MNSHRPLIRAVTLLVSALCLLTMTGCFGVDGQFKKLRNNVVEGAGIDYHVEAEFGIGPMLIGMAKTIVSWSDDSDAEVAIDLLRQIQKVQIGVYQLEDFHLGKADVRDRIRSIVGYMSTNGYDAIVRTFEDSGGSLIMVRAFPENPDRVKEVVVLSFDMNELNIVQLKGDVNEIVDVAVREHEVPGVDEAVEEAH